jgi:Flp pilus assembly protein TadG
MGEWKMTMQAGGRGGAVIKRAAPAISTNILRRSVRRLALLMRAERGNAAIEFALATPILIGMLVPVADIGIAFAQQLQVQQAAQAGAQYALLHGYNSTAISSAVTAATTLSSVSAAPAPTQSYGCPTGTTITAATMGSTCANGETAGTYVFVNAQAAYTPALPYSVLGSGVTLTAQTAVRIK